MIVNKPYYMNRRDNPNSSVNNKDKVYCSNIEYDYIKDILMRDPEIWERFKYMYSLKKLHNYTFTLGRIADVYKKEYIERISKEFKRAMDNGELDQNVFRPAEWNKLMFMIKNPEGYYLKYWLRDGDAKYLEKRVNDLEKSTTYRVGKAVMYLPIKVKKAIKKKK